MPKSGQAMLLEHIPVSEEKPILEICCLEQGFSFCRLLFYHAAKTPTGWQYREGMPEGLETKKSSNAGWLQHTLPSTFCLGCINLNAEIQISPNVLNLLNLNPILFSNSKTYERFSGLG